MPLLPVYEWTIGQQVYPLKLTIREELALQEQLGLGIEAMLVGEPRISRFVALLGAGLRGGGKSTAEPAELLALITSACLPLPELALDVDGAHYSLTGSLAVQMAIEQRLDCGIATLKERGLNTGLREMLTVIGEAVKPHAPKIQTQEDIEELAELVTRHHLEDCYMALLFDMVSTTQPVIQAASEFLVNIIGANAGAWTELDKRLGKHKRKRKEVAEPDPLAHGAISSPSVSAP